ncbi:hypothetical protein BZA77DRAFT_309004 [Pyronema omphalodes]|nr:hypothetical protein BZA77DRAFT_329993 [Pyronema omphalodes]KAI5817630.1 hypothetical protein BZA77DRAFT_309004 [Pyronema omphalodes]
MQLIGSGLDTANLYHALRLRVKLESLKYTDFPRTPLKTYFSELLRIRSEFLKMKAPIDDLDFRIHIYRTIVNLREPAFRWWIEEKWLEQQSLGDFIQSCLDQEAVYWLGEYDGQGYRANPNQPIEMHFSKLFLFRERLKGTIYESYVRKNMKENVFRAGLERLETEVGKVLLLASYRSEHTTADDIVRDYWTIADIERDDAANLKRYSCRV